MPTQNHQTEAKASWDKVWDKVFQELEWGKYPGESLIRFIARNFYKRDRKNTKLLEVGCGPGANVWYMAREGFDVYGMEGSKTAVERGKARMEKEGVKVTFSIGDIVALPYQNGFFDGVVDAECLTHNNRENLERILKEIRRVLKTGGLFYSRTFTEQVYLGKNPKQVGPNEFIEASDGPFFGRGFVRLTTREGVEELYGKYFKILSVDKNDYTEQNGKILISEWVIICQKEGK